MIAFLFKYWKIFLDCVIVVAALIALAIIDPFGMFSKRELRGTANLVSSVRDIGELVTAEYYGEVLSSLNETYVFDLKPDSVTVYFENCFVELKELCDQLKKDDKGIKAKEILKKGEFKKIRDKYSNDSINIYKYLVTFLGVYYLKEDQDKFMKKDKLRGGAEKRLVNFILDDLDKIRKKKRLSKVEKNELYRKYIYDIPDYFKKAESFYFNIKQEHADKKLKKKDILIIGRGWVKAGYKFDRLDERNFIYDENQKRIIFYGLSPVILDHDINPWFIPEKRIKGFDVIAYYKGATFEQAKKVKIKCKQKLIEQASKASILKNAEENGALALKNFFSLLLNEPDLDIEFKDIPHKKIINVISADTLITVNEALEIDSIIQDYKNTIAVSASPGKEQLQKELKIFFNQLTGLPFISKKDTFNFYSLEVAKILENKYYITYADYEKFNDSVRSKLILEKNNNEDSIISAKYLTGYKELESILPEYPEFVQQFNKMALCLQEQIDEAIRDSNITVEIKQSELDKVLKDTIYYFIDVDTTDKMIEKERVYVLNRERDSLTYQFSDLVYPEFSVSKKYSDTLSLSDVGKIESYLKRRIKDIDYTTQHPQMDSLRKEELYTVIKPYEYKRIKDQVLLRPINKAISWVHKP